jgi:hypothetical protein
VERRLEMSSSRPRGRKRLIGIGVGRALSRGAGTVRQRSGSCVKVHWPPTCPIATFGSPGHSLSMTVLISIESLVNHDPFYGTPTKSTPLVLAETAADTLTWPSRPGRRRQRVFITAAWTNIGAGRYVGEAASRWARLRTLPTWGREGARTLPTQVVWTLPTLTFAPSPSAEDFTDPGFPLIFESRGLYRPRRLSCDSRSREDFTDRRAPSAHSPGEDFTDRS